MDIVIPYPEGIDKDNYDFIIGIIGKLNIRFQMGNVFMKNGESMQMGLRYTLPVLRRL